MMTEITRSIEILASSQIVWEHVNPQEWVKIFNFVSEVEGYEEKPGIGTTATISAGGGQESEINYKVKITGLEEGQKIEFERFGGPLSGRGVIKIKDLQSGSLLTRTGFYKDDLSAETVKTLGEGMEQDNLRIKQKIENGTNPTD